MNTSNQPSADQEETDPASENNSSSEEVDQAEVISEEETSNYINTLVKPVGVWKIVLLATLSILLIGSVILNVSFFGLSEIHPSSDLSVTAWVLVSVFGLISVISLSAIFWMYYVRTLLLKDGPALVPEKWGSVLAELTKTIFQTNQQAASMLEGVVRESMNQSEKSESLLNSFLVLQEALDSRDREIERLKKGYDAKIFKKFLNRFIRVDRALVDIGAEAKDEAGVKNFRYLNRLMEDALDECGVERYTPELGADYRSIGNGVADEPTVIAAEDAESDFSIAAVESEGYVIQGEEGTQVIIPAKVAIYRFNHDTEQEGDQ